MDTICTGSPDLTSPAAIAQNLQRERNRLEKADATDTPSRGRQSIADSIAFLEQQLSKLQQDIDSHIITTATGTTAIGIYYRMIEVGSAPKTRPAPLNRDRKSKRPVLFRPVFQDMARQDMNSMFISRNFLKELTEKNLEPSDNKRK